MATGEVTTEAGGARPLRDRWWFGLLLIFLLTGPMNFINGHAVRLCQRSGMVAAQHFLIPATVALFGIDFVAFAILVLHKVFVRKVPEGARVDLRYLPPLLLAAFTGLALMAMDSLTITGPGAAFLQAHHLSVNPWSWMIGEIPSLIALVFFMTRTVALPKREFNEYADRGY
jgi:hypothetical protein